MALHVCWRWVNRIQYIWETLTAFIRASTQRIWRKVSGKRHVVRDRSPLRDPDMFGEGEDASGSLQQRCGWHRGAFAVATSMAPNPLFCHDSPLLFAPTADEQAVKDLNTGRGRLEPRRVTLDSRLASLQTVSCLERLHEDTSGTGGYSIAMSPVHWYTERDIYWDRYNVRTRARKRL